MKIKQADGKEIEVFTKEEVDAQVKTAKDEAIKTASEAATKTAKEAADAAIEEYKKNNPDKSTEITAAQTKIKDLESALEQAKSYGGEGNRDEQIIRLKKEKDDAVADLTKKIGDLTKTMEDKDKGQRDGYKSELLDEYTKDPDMRKKLEFEFDQYNPTDTSLKGMEERMEKAAMLAGVKAEAKPGVMDSGGGHGGNKGEGNYGGNNVEITTNAVAIGKNLGVSEQELKDHAAKKAETNK